VQQQSIEAIVLSDRTHFDYYCQCILIFFSLSVSFCPTTFRFIPCMFHEIVISECPSRAVMCMGGSMKALSVDVIHTYITWVHKCVTKTIGCGTSHKYTNIHNFCSEKYYKHFIKQYYRYLYA